MGTARSAVGHKELVGNTRKYRHISHIEQFLIKFTQSFFTIGEFSQGDL